MIIFTLRRNISMKMSDNSLNVCDSCSHIYEAMYCWGSTVHGELGLGGIEEEQIFSPLELKWNIVNKVVQVACGENHTLIVTNDGEVYSCGNNDNGQLGHHQPRKRPQLIEALKSYKITQVSCGEAHSVALSQWGQVFSWGQDSYGQLGHNLNVENQAIPKIIKSICTHHIVQIACGKKHTLVLTNSGELYAWGANQHGQLGIGRVTHCESKPTRITSLDGVPIANIACGGHHSFALSCSGTVFGWGKNTFGQLGLNNEVSQSFPSQLKTLRNVRVKYIACGEDFSVFLTQDGGVFTCGSGRYGQLGHGSTSDEILPRKVLELMGSTITQISCGGRHTLAFVPSRGRVYGFGLGGSGQLGVRKACNASTPQVVIGPWGSVTGTSLIPNTPATCSIKQIFSGGDRCFVIVTSIDDNISPVDYRLYPSESQILRLTVDQMYKCQALPSNCSVDQDLLAYLETVFKSLACINASFLLQGDEHYGCSSKRPGIDLKDAEEAFQYIAKIEHDAIRELIWHSLQDVIRNQLVPSPPDVESLRIYFTIPLYHEFCNTKHYKILHQPFANALLNLTKPAQKVTFCWWSMSNKEYFERLIEVFKNVVDFIIRLQIIPENQTVQHDSNLVTILDTLDLFNKLNHNFEGLKVSYDTFHLSNLAQYCDLRVDYVHWLRDTSSSKLYLCNYPFLFNAEAKTKLLETDQAIQMQMAMNEAASRAFASIFLGPLVPSVNAYMVLEVSRENLVVDALRELTEMTTSDLKKPLKVKFYGEEAEDAGGVKKEFFMLLLREIFDPKYGMFKEYEETRAMWFSEDSFEDEIMYLLIGILCGLAIYNFIIINLPFPLALYKKLLGEQITVGDVKELSPSMYNSLQTLLDYDKPDLEDVFCLNFEITRDVYGEIKNIPLKPNGENIPVTQKNKEEYVKLYVDYIFDTSVEKHYTAFSKGFLRVCGGRVLKLFHAQELQAVIVGNEDYNWHDLESVAEYKNGYTSSDQTIRWFWEVLHELPLSEKKKFLLFLTGSDRIPITGMKELKIIFQPTTDDKFLPVAHTCFNLLDLPRYKTKEKLRYKLLQAIQQNEGFSLV